MREKHKQNLESGEAVTWPEHRVERVGKAVGEARGQLDQPRETMKTRRGQNMTEVGEQGGCNLTCALGQL